MGEVAARTAQLYANMHIAMDHVMALMVPIDRPLPTALALDTSQRSALESWQLLTAVVDRRQQKEEKRRRKEKEKKAKKDKQEVKERKNGKSALSIETKNVKTAKAAIPPKKAVARNAAVSPRPATPPVQAHDRSTDPVLDKLQELPGLKRLVAGSTKHKALVRWLEADQGKNLAISSELQLLVKRLNVKKEHLSDKDGKETKRKKKTLLSETLDDRLRAERKHKLALQRERISMARKRRVIDDEDEEMGDIGGDAEEPEYADGYSDSGEDEYGDDEAEFMPSLSTTPRAPSPPRPSKKRAAKSPAAPSPAKAAASAPSPSSSGLSAEAQLKLVVAKIKQEDLLSDNKEAQYLTYSSAPSTSAATSASAPARSSGSSARNAIVLDDSEEEEDDEEDEKGQPHEGDEEEEANAADSSTDDDQELFDLNEEDVYIVESILKVKEGRTIPGKYRTKEEDLYLVKWDSYNELTWEPASNIPRQLIEFFLERERAKRSCQYQINEFVERRLVDNVTTGMKEIIYLIQWSNQSQAVWEVRSALPEKTAIWLDKVAGANTPPTKKRLKINARR